MFVAFASHAQISMKFLFWLLSALRIQVPRIYTQPSEMEDKRDREEAKGRVRDLRIAYKQPYPFILKHWSQRADRKTRIVRGKRQNWSIWDSRLHVVLATAGETEKETILDSE